MSTPVPNIATPAKTFRPIHPPLPFKITPAIGGPHKLPNPPIAEFMPSLVPSRLISVLKLATATAGSGINPPLKRPYKAAKATRPPAEDGGIAIQQSDRVPVRIEVNIRMLTGPAWRSGKPEHRRPKIEVAFKIARR
jgi:hypothetical protein